MRPVLPTKAIRKHQRQCYATPSWSTGISNEQFCELESIRKIVYCHAALGRRDNAMRRQCGRFFQRRRLGNTSDSAMLHLHGQPASQMSSFVSWKVLEKSFIATLR